jgi:glycosyltransferase involved in cell wall biosynthesis
VKKLISVCIPCRNEVDNVHPLAEELITHLKQLHKYDFEIIFIDNCSMDGTQEKLRGICALDKRLKVILNANNYSYSLRYLWFKVQGDCIISIPSDFQVPVELIPQMIAEWENGAKVVAPVKNTGKHDKYRLFRNLYYKMSCSFSKDTTIPGFVELAALYDKDFIKMCKALNDPGFSMQYMVIQYAYPLVKLRYDERPRRSGRSNTNFGSLLNIAVLRFIRASDTVPRYAVFSGIGMGIISFLISIYYLISKILRWDHFPKGIAPLVIGMFLLGAIQLIFIGIIGEYLINMNERQKKLPLVVEKERINFEENSPDQ